MPYAPTPISDRMIKSIYRTNEGTIFKLFP